MTTLPGPLTPPDSDLQDFHFMPLHVARLRDSDFAATEDPEACWYGVLLWSASWHQIPAASLPDDDAVLTRLCGLGRDLKTFKRHRRGALRGFVRCSDGRLYHPVVAEQARAAWRSKIEQRFRSECARGKKTAQRSGGEYVAPTFDCWFATQGLAPLVPKTEAACPEGQPALSLGTTPPCPEGQPPPVPRDTPPLSLGTMAPRDRDRDRDRDRVGEGNTILAPLGRYCQRGAMRRPSARNNRQSGHQDGHHPTKNLVYYCSNTPEQWTSTSTPVCPCRSTARSSNRCVGRWPAASGAQVTNCPACARWPSSTPSTP